MTSMGFPTLQSLRNAVRQLEPPHRVLFQLFRTGDTVDDESIKAMLPRQVFAALITAELLVRDDTGGWRTPSLLIVPAEGLYLLVGIPPIYSTTGFDLSSHIVAKALPVSLNGQRVLDICSGSGIQGLLCATRGANSVVGLELNEEAVTTARANAILNNLEARIEFRQSDKLESLRENERFDFVVCNTPTAPMVDGSSVPSGPEAIGNVVLLLAGSARQATRSSFAAQPRNPGGMALPRLSIADISTENCRFTPCERRLQHRRLRR
jgi:hypothetical protein